MLLTEEKKEHLVQELKMFERKLEVLELEEESKRQARQRELDLIHNVSHALRTPLTTVREGISQVCDQLVGSTTPRQDNYLSAALFEVDRLTRIVDEYLDMSRIEAGTVNLKRDVVDLVKVVREVVNHFSSRARTKGIDLEHNFPDAAINVFVDSDRIVQVLTNLVSNAIKFTKQGRVTVSICDAGEMIECMIEDTGCGIVKEEMPNLFRRFHQAGRVEAHAEKGTGLGLAISKEFVDLHKGRIWVESKAGKGSRFIFSLPKYSPSELIQESIAKGLSEAVAEETALSLLLFDVANYDDVQKHVGKRQVERLIKSIAEEIKLCFRRESDQTGVWDFRSILTVLPSTSKKDAAKIAKRVQVLVSENLLQKERKPTLRLACRIASFPEDGRTEQALLNKAFS
jgi:nitrogen-specific signal transduction histidine kinase